MHRLKPLFILLLLSPLALVHAQQTKRVLFLGNSYTQYNQLPVLIDNLANASGHDLIHDQNTPGGQQLIQHASNATSLAKIKAQNWDYVVIQAQSQEPSFSPGQVAANTYPYAAILNDSILANNPCTEPLFYMTWGRKNGDASNCGVYPPICTYDGMQQRLRESYLEMAQDNNASVAPVGVAWKTVRDLYPGIELYNPDQSHPSLAGSYLAACVFYASIFRETVVGNTFISSLDSLTAYRLQSVASSTVLDSLSLWHIDDNDLGLSLPADTSLCGDSLTISAQNVMGQLMWSTNDTIPSITVMNSTLIYAQVLNARNCSFSDSIDIDLNTGIITNVIYEACDSFELNGVLYFGDTVLTETFVLGNGCDSVYSSVIMVSSIPQINYDFNEVDFINDVLYINGETYDSTFIVNQASGDTAINQDTLRYSCRFFGYALAWNACGMDSVVLNNNCGSIEELDNSWSIGPNPVNRSILISNTKQKGFSLEIIDPLGRVVYQEAYENKQVREINLEDLNPNIYYLVLYDQQGKTLGKKTIQKQ